MNGEINLDDLTLGQIKKLKEANQDSELTTEDKYQIQQAIMTVASQKVVDDLPAYAKSLCEAVKAIKTYQ